MKEHISPCFWLSPPLAPDVSICSASSLIYEVPSLPCAQGFFSQLSGRWEESEKEKRQTGDTVRRSSKGQGTSLSQPPSGLRKRAWELCRTSSPHPLGWDCSFCCFSRPGSRTPCPSTTGSLSLLPPGIQACVCLHVWRRKHFKRHLQLCLALGQLKGSQTRGKCWHGPLFLGDQQVFPRGLTPQPPLHAARGD